MYLFTYLLSAQDNIFPIFIYLPMCSYFVYLSTEFNAQNNSFPVYFHLSTHVFLHPSTQLISQQNTAPVRRCVIALSHAPFYTTKAKGVREACAVTKSDASRCVIFGFVRTEST